MSGEEMKQAVKKAVVGSGDPATAFFNRGILSSEFIFVLLFCVGIYANYAWLDGKVPDKAIDLIGLYVGGWAGIRLTGKLAMANPGAAGKPKE